MIYTQNSYHYLKDFFIQKEPSVLEGSTYAHPFYKLLLTATSLMISTQPSIPKVLEFNEIS